MRKTHISVSHMLHEIIYAVTLESFGCLSYQPKPPIQDSAANQQIFINLLPSYDETGIPLGKFKYLICSVTSISHRHQDQTTSACTVIGQRAHVVSKPEWLLRQCLNHGNVQNLMLGKICIYTLI